jgi:hypothetical protein
MVADARVLIFHERTRDHLDTGYPCRARHGCRITQRSGGAASSQRKGPTLRHDGTGCDAGHHDCAIGTRRRNVVGCDRCVRFHPDHRPCFHAARRPSHHRRRNRRRDWAVADLLADRGLGCVKPCSAGGQHPGRALITGKRTRLRSSRRTKARSTRLLARGYF